MHIDPNHKSGNAALDRCLALIGETFRPERKERESVILSGHRVQALVEAGRYDFTEACRLLEVDAEKVSATLEWLIEDNSHMNAIHECYTHECSSNAFMMVGWFKEQTANKIVPLARAS